MPVGRKPKPPDLKLVTGNPGKRPIKRAPTAPGALEYVDVAIKRFQQNHPGVPVTLLATGQSFDDVASERLATTEVAQ